MRVKASLSMIFPMAFVYLDKRDGLTLEVRGWFERSGCWSIVVMYSCRFINRRTIPSSDLIVIL